HRLLRLDEGAADVVVADQAEPHRDAGCLAKANRRAHAGIGNRNDDVSRNGSLRREIASEGRADLVDAAAEYITVGTRKVDVLEYAVRELGRRVGPDR